jgi:hypothetical protein
MVEYWLRRSSDLWSANAAGAPIKEVSIMKADTVAIADAWAPENKVRGKTIFMAPLQTDDKGVGDRKC